MMTLAVVSASTSLDDVRINFDNEALWIMNIALAVIMFGVALGITMNDFKRLLQNPKMVIAGILSQFLVLPALTYVIIRLVEPAPSIALGMMMVAACPGGNISNFMTHLARGNTALSVSLTAFATFLAMFLTPLNFQFYGNLYPPTAAILKTVALDPFELVKLVVLILGIPLILGMWLRYLKPEMARKWSKLLKPFSILFFIALIILAFSKNLDVFTEYVSQVMYLGISHNLIAILAGLAIATLFKLPFKEQKTIAIETGIQNSGLGLLLIFSFFGGLGGMALIAAFWGIWHIVSGLLLAGYWSLSTSKQLET